jgi:hypothetical protein
MRRREYASADFGIFNRSYHEEVLVLRVHPDISNRQKLPPKVMSGRIWHELLAELAGIRSGTIAQLCYYFARTICHYVFESVKSTG